jgi:hypothetical protein
LDVGCGCGRHSTSTLARHCDRVVAIDVARYISRWRELSWAHGVSFCCMDAVTLGFASGSFPLVLEATMLHHITHWAEAIGEMIRVSSGHILFQEPVDDLRSAAKRRSYEAQDLLLRLQAEVGYPHYRHLDREALLSAVERQAVVLEAELERSDAPIAFDDFFESYHAFASRSDREDYWLTQLQDLRSRFGGAALCEDDTLIVLAVKDPSRRSQ